MRKIQWPKEKAQAMGEGREETQWARKKDFLFFFKIFQP